MNINIETPTLSWASSAPGTSTKVKKATGPGSQWQALNISDSIVKSLIQRKFRNPTPIQRTSIPPALSTPPRDILGMARTGSGKTLAYLIPLLQRLGSTHVDIASPRALILCPSRELAVQIFSVGKDLARGMGKGKANEAENLRWAIIIGGEGMEGQFEKMSSNPDMTALAYDSLFEMGFDAQLREILSRLPSTRQNLLFSATLPSSVAEFAKAGLVNPLLIRLDSEDKISPDLDLRFVSVKPSEKDAALLILLRDAIGVHLNPTDNSANPQVIVFVSTKHHVDYISELLSTAGYRTSHIYSSLDQTARQQQFYNFRKHLSDVLVVTDVAARGLDIPVMDHVINYDFTPGPRVFVHRVGRTARAGRKGNAWSLVTRDDWPYLFDLQTFLGSLRMGSDGEMLRALPDDKLSEITEYMASSLEESAPNLVAQRNVMRKGQAMFERSRGKASAASYRKAKSFGKQVGDRTISIPVDPLFMDLATSTVATDRSRLLSTVAAYTPAETVFEVGKRGDSMGATLMKKRRSVIDSRKRIPRAEPEEDNAVAASNEHELAPVRSFRDPAFYMEHVQQGAEAEKGYSLQSGASLPETMTTTTMELMADEGAGPKAQKASQLRWDRKSRKFVQNSSEGTKMIRTESGVLLPATYSSGLYSEWKAKRRTGNPNPDRSSTTSRHGPANSKSSDRHHHGRSALSSELRTASSIRTQRHTNEQRQLKTGRRSKQARGKV